MAGSVPKGFASQFSVSKAYLGYSGSNSNVGYFNGEMDDVLIFDKALNANEISVLYGLGSNVTSVEESANPSKNLIYPNPVLDVLNVNGKAEIFSISGQKLFEGLEKINVSELQNGIYLVKVNNIFTKIVKE